LKSKNCYRGNRNKEFCVGDVVMCRNYTGGDEWVQAVITQKLSPVTYDIRLGDGRDLKRHINQIIDCELNVEKNFNADQSFNFEEKDIIEEGLDGVKQFGNDVQGESDQIQDKDDGEGTKRPKRVISPPLKLNL